MKILVSTRAYRQRKKLPPRLKKKTLELIGQLADNPFPPQSKKLAGTQYYRLRYGDYRIIYDVHSKTKTVSVLAVAHRRSVYKLI